MATKKQVAKPRGPAPERLKIDLPVEEAIKRALAKEKPPDGWPKHPRKAQ